MHPVAKKMDPVASHNTIPKRCFLTSLPLFVRLSLFYNLKENRFLVPRFSAIEAQEISSVEFDLLMLARHHFSSLKSMDWMILGAS